MAALVRALRNLRITPNDSKQLLSPVVPLIDFNKNTSFFNKLPAEKLWKSVLSVSNAGAKKGRGKGAGRKRATDLNKGQIIGVGKNNIVWPGLNAPIIKGNELIRQQKLPDNPKWDEKVIEYRDSVKVFRFLKLAPLERGWTSTKWPGRKLGPPDPIGQDTFEGFESICLEFKPLSIMTGTLGRVRSISTFVVTGNGNGLAGFAVGKAQEGNSALRKARNRAAQKLMLIELCEGRTVYHDFYTQFGATKLFVCKKPEGHGLKCHRAVRAICQVLGIKDLYAKLEGASNVQHIVKAFFIGLLKQKTYKEIAEDKKLHLVEFKKENLNFPNVVASPSTCRKADEIPFDEVLDFTQYNHEGRVVLIRKSLPPFYTRLPHWKTTLKIKEKRRCYEDCKMNALVEYGAYKSFLNDKYPEEPEVNAEE